MIAMKRESLQARLEALGKVHIDAPLASTVDDIERRWRHSIGPEVSTTTRPGPRRRPRRSRRLALAGVVLTMAGAITLTVVAVGATHHRHDAVVVTAADDVVVVLPNGRVVAPQPGDVIPDGAVIQAGPQGSGRIGGVAVHAQDSFRVVDHHVEATPTTVASTVPAPEASTTSTPPTTAPATSTTLSGPARLSVQATRRGRRVVLSWQATTDPDFVRYELWRVGSWDGHDLPSGAPLVWTSRRSANRQVVTGVHPGSLYVVAALGPQRQVLAIGAAMTPS